jgi:hypothetical protein
MLKVTVNGMRMRVTARYRVDGSVLNDTIQGRMLGADTTLEIDSPDPPERVARVVRDAERGCFVMQALQQPMPGHGPHDAQRRTPARVTARGGAPGPTPGASADYFLSIILSSFFIMLSSFFIIPSPLDAHPLKVSPDTKTIAAIVAVHRPAAIDMSPS